MEKNAKILVLGARGLVGSAIVQELRAQGYHNIYQPGRTEVDLTDEVTVRWLFSVHRPEYVFFAAAKVGGISDNASDKVGFLAENLRIELNVITAAAEYAVKKLLFVATSCIYPRDCPQPIREEYLMTGPLERTTEAYSIAKIAGIRLCQYYREQLRHDFVVAVPCNIFGERDNFNERTAHCLPGLMARIHRAKVTGAPEVVVWGDGTAQREFLFAPDLARALILVMERYSSGEPINTGSGFELSIKDLATVLAEKVIGYRGRLVFDTGELTGTPRKVLESSKLRALGWRPEIPFIEALRATYSWHALSL